MPRAARTLGAAIPVLLAISGCVTRPSRERPPTLKVLSETAEANRLPARRLPPPPEAQRPPQDLTLDEARRLALRQSERLERAGEDILQAHLWARQALATALPRLDLVGVHTRIEETPAFGGEDFNPRQKNEYYFELSVPLFAGFKEFRALKQANIQQAARRASLKDIRDQLLLDVTEAFYRVLQARQEVAVREVSLSLQEERLREAEARFRLGALRRTEVLQTQAELAQNRSSLVRARQTLDVMRNILGFLIGYPPPDVLIDPKSTPMELLDSESLVAEAQRSRQDLRFLERMAEAAQRSITVAAADYYPSLRLNAEYYGRREGAMKGIDWEARLLADLPLFDGGLRHARLREAYSRLRQAELDRDGLRRRIDQEVRQAVAELRSSRSLLDALREQQAASEESYRRMKAEFDRGAATNLEVITSQNLMLLSRIELARELFEERIKEARLARSLGRPIAPGGQPTAPAGSEESEGP